MRGALLPADVQQVLALVQVFRVRPHVVPELQQTVGEAFEDGVAAGGPAHRRQHRHWGEGGVTDGPSPVRTGPVNLRYLTAAHVIRS